MRTIPGTIVMLAAAVVFAAGVMVSDARDMAPLAFIVAAGLGFLGGALLCKGFIQDRSRESVSERPPDEAGHSKGAGDV